MMKKHLQRTWAVLLLLVIAGSGQLFAQNRISGTVKDANGDPVVAAGVFVKGTTIGSTTDANGAYSMSVPDNAVIVASCIGYVQVERKLARGQARLDFVLEEDKLFLEETVVIGYGTQKKSDVTGSVASVDSESMHKRSPISIAQGLQGAAAGVVITQSSGDPTGGYNIRIRGVATVNGDTNPLWIVDGIDHGTSSNLSWLDPQDVESVEILKDASATAIYGANGANGVILVTTRKGQAGKTRVDFNASVGISTFATRLDMASLSDWLGVYRQSIETDGRSPFPAFAGAYDGQLHEIDWQDVMTQTAVRQQYNVSVSGGSEHARTNFSIGYMDNKGIIVNSWQKRLFLRLNSDFDVTRWLKVGLSINFNTSKGKGGGNMINYARLVPTMDYIDRETNQLVHVPVVYEDGTFGHYMFHQDVELSGGMYTGNPYADQFKTTFGKDWDGDSGSVRNAFWAQVTLAKGLTFRTNLKYDFSGSNSWSYSPSFVGTYYDWQQLNGDKAVDSFSTNGSASTSMSAENYLTFDRSFGKHHVAAMIGQSAGMSHGSWNNSSTKDLTFPFLRGFFSTNDEDYDKGGGGPNIQSRHASYFARFNYAYDSKYMLTATVRRDGSSNFGRRHRWGTFPSFSAAWNLGSEPFIKQLRLFDVLKLRAGWGTTGNSNVSATASVPQMSTGATFDYFDEMREYIRLVGIMQSSEIDQGLHWETSVQTNFGLDLAMLHNSLTFSVDYYIRDTRDLILNKTIRPSAGFTSITTNFGSIRNTGLEFALGYKRVIGRDWFISASATASTNWNKAVDIGAGTTNSGAQGSGWENYQVCYNGLPLGTYQGYRVDHIIQDQAEIDALNAAAVEKFGPGSYYDMAGTAPGDFLFKDLNGDGHITTADKDYLGNGFPALSYGLNLSASYRNWDLSVYMYGALGQTLLSWSKCYLTTLRNESNGYFNFLSEAVKDTWSPANKGAAYPRATRTDVGSNTRVSDFYVEKADYLKISNLQLGYTFDKKVLGGAFRNARISLSIQNLLTLSPYTKFGDPEVSSGVTSTGYDSGRYPFPRTFLLGVQLGL